MRVSTLLSTCVLAAGLVLASGAIHGRRHHGGHKQPSAVHHPAVHAKAQYPHLNLGVPPTAPYNISDAYVLGLSSGGFLAVQMHVAYSNEFTGAGIFAAGPYYCAQGSIMGAMETCVEALQPINLQSLETTAVELMELGLVDGLKNISGSPVYLFHGTSDRTVFAPVNNALYQMYLDFGANVAYNNATDANHAWISPTGPNACTQSSSPYISNCPEAGDVENLLLTHMLQQTIAPAASTATGNVYSFSQDQYAESGFAAPASSFSMDSTGYVYLPASCAAGVECRLLVVLHGCEQGYSSIGNALIQDSNLNVYADTNNLIVLYPQAISSAMMENPEGCWDWWGYTGGGSTRYATHGAPQMEIVRSIMNALGFKGKPLRSRLAAEQF